MGLTKRSLETTGKTYPGLGYDQSTLQYVNVLIGGKNVVQAKITNTHTSSSSTSMELSRVAYTTPNVNSYITSRIPLPFCEQSFKRETLTPWRGKISVISANFGQLGSYSYVQQGCFDNAVNNVAGWLNNKGSIGTLSSSQMLSVDNFAKNKVLLKIKDQKINVVQAMAERSQTASLIASSATKIAKALLAVKRGNLVEAARSLGVGVPKRAARRAAREVQSNKRSSSSDIARRWLELQYGWKPLLNDIYGAAEHLATRDTGPKHMQTSASATIGISWNKDIPWDFTKSYNCSGSVQYTRKYTVRYAVTNSQVRELSQTGVTNPALIAWELMPWSFVIDWFVPIGNFISTLDATAGVTFLSGCVSTVTKVRGVGSMTYSGALYQNERRSGSMSNHLFRDEVTRIKLASFPSPALPQFKSPVSLTHMANALALLQLQRK